MAKLQDADLLLVQRGSDSFKFTAKELLDQAVENTPSIDELNDVGDVDVSGAASGQVLTLVGNEWKAQDISVEGGLTFQGALDVTSEEPPVGPENGWVIINTGSGTVGANWTGVAGESVSGGEQLIYDSGSVRSAGWVIVTGGGNIGVETVTASGGIKETSGDSANPVLVIDRTTTDGWYMGAGSVAAKPSGGLKGNADELEIDRTVTDAWYVQPADLTNLTDGSADLVVNSVKANKFDISGLTALS